MKCFELGFFSFQTTVHCLLIEIEHLIFGFKRMYIVYGTLKIVRPITTFLYFLYLLKVLKDGSKTCKVHLSQSEIFTNIYERHAHALFQLKSFF